MADNVHEGVIKVVELVGVSQQSWSDAARRAVEEASKTIRGINGIDVVNSSAKVEDGKVTEYRVAVKIAFPVERGGSAG
jgi:flavin-binding protein dodecin